MSLRVALCQLNFVVGDLDGNADGVLDALRTAEEARCDVAVFSELAISGYPPEDLLFKPRFLADCRQALDKVASATSACAVVVGFPDGDADASHVYNGAAVCADGELKGVAHKRELPNYTVFDDQRYFLAGDRAMQLYEIAGVEVGVSICEDLWIAGGPVNQLAAGGAQVVLNINASPYRAGKIHRRTDIMRSRALETAVPIVYVNQVGGQDELVFDGDSMVVDGTGAVVARAAQFGEEIMVLDVEPRPAADRAVAFPIRAVTDASLAPRSPVDATIAPLLEPLDEIYEALVVGTRDYVHKNGFSDICLGLSGGIDSSLVGLVATDALGPDHVHTVAMPSRFSSEHSLDDAATLAAELGVDHRVLPIEPAHQATLDILAPSFADLEPGLAEENIQARIRGMLLMALANKFGWLVLTTGNKSELAVGYSTLYGDTAGAFAVIKDVWKLTVYDLCRRRNELAGREIIPDAVITKPPSAELRPDQRDDQNLPSYELLDPLLCALVEEDRTAAELIAEGHDAATVTRIARLVDTAEYKRRQNPIGPRVSTRAFGKERRMPITSRYLGT